MHPLDKLLWPLVYYTDTQADLWRPRKSWPSTCQNLSFPSALLNCKITGAVWNNQMLGLLGQTGLLGAKILALASASVLKLKFWHQPCKIMASVLRVWSHLTLLPFSTNPQEYWVKFVLYCQFSLANVQLLNFNWKTSVVCHHLGVNTEDPLQ